MLNGTSKYLYRALELQKRQGGLAVENHSSQAVCRALCLSQQQGWLAGTGPCITCVLGQWELPD